MAAPHLTPDQIHWLLQFARLGTRNSQTHADSDPLHEYEEHLASCATCRAALRMEEEGYMQLTSLRSTTLSSSSTGPTQQCLPYEVWLELAVGIPRNDSKELMEHVIQCDTCSLRLKAADDELHSPLSIQEEAALSELDASSVNWPRSFAPRLAAQCPRPTKNFTFDGLRSWLSPAGLAVAAAACALVLVAMHDRRLGQELQRTRSQLALQTAPPTALPSRAMPPGLAAPVELTPGLTRGLGHMARLSLIPNAAVVPITLLTNGDPGGEVVEQLMTANGEHLWMQRTHPSTLERSTHRLTIFLPAALLVPDDYQIQLVQVASSNTQSEAGYTSGVGPSNSLPETTYTFRVTP